MKYVLKIPLLPKKYTENLDPRLFDIDFYDLFISFNGGFCEK